MEALKQGSDRKDFSEETPEYPNKSKGRTRFEYLKVTYFGSFCADGKIEAFVSKSHSCRCELFPTTSVN